MSHFSVIVVTAEKPTDEILAAVLQPFHEFECTGDDDEFVQDVDKTEEALAEFEKATVTRLRDPSGALHEIFDLQGAYKAEFAQPDRERGSGRKLRVPPGWEEVEVAAKDHETAAKWIADYHGWSVLTIGNAPSETHKYGRIEVDASGNVVRCIDRTNPNAKWDWWQVGGRYSGKFSPGYDPETDPNHQETCWLCRGTGKRIDMVVENGCNGCQGKGISTKWPTQWKNTPGNQIRVGDIPWSALRAERVHEALKEYDKAAALTKGLELPPLPWLQVYDKGEEAREAWRSNAAVKALHEWWGTADIIETLRQPRDEIATKAARQPITTFAMLHEGKWYERGKMGWWACVSDEKDEAAWGDEVNKLLESLPADFWLTCVDCHR